jgi:tetratricopeptide (TPR) repeat protein
MIEKKPHWKAAAFSLAALIVALLSIRTIARNVDWKDEDHLWIATAKVSPSGENIHNNLGDVYTRQGNLEKAVSEFQHATEINPGYADAYHNLANAYQTMGKTDLAIENYEKAASINPALWQSYQNLATIYFNQGDSQEAMDYLKKALAVNPNDENLQKSLQAVQAKMEKK